MTVDKMRDERDKFGLAPMKAYLLLANIKNSVKYLVG